MDTVQKPSISEYQHSTLKVTYIFIVTCLRDITACTITVLPMYSESHSKVAPENVGLHLHVIPVWNAVVTGGAGNVLLYVQYTLDLLQLCRRTWGQLFAAVITHANKILQDINKWFTTNLLSLNAEKTQYMQFVTKTNSLTDLHIMYNNTEIANTCNTKFLRLTLDNTFSLKNHIDANVPKLSSACFTVRAVKPFLSQ
jgi:hypothetical protein